MEIQQLQVRITAETRQLNNSLNEIKRELGQIQYKNAANENSFRELNRQGSAQIKALEKDLAAVNQIIADERKYLKEYIDQKEKLYQKLRLRDKNKQ